MPVLRHLSERQRAIEVAAALYAMGFGGFIGSLISLGFPGPLIWTGWTIEVQEDVAFLMCLCGLIHALGVRVNGNWRWSPVMRFVGMTAHLCIIIAIWLHTPLFSTAQYTYAWLTFFLLVGAISAWRDTSLALRNQYGSGDGGTFAEST